jgi:DNA-binding NtrC family response regulator
MPVTQGSTPKTAILAVTGNQRDLEMLHCLFAGSSWKLCTAGTLAEAGEWLRRNATPAVLCEAKLRDGDWKDLLRTAGGLDRQPMVVVTSRHADDKLWADALNLGAFDVLAYPARQAELFRLLSNAWRTWKDGRRRRSIGLVKSVPMCGT